MTVADSGTIWIATFGPRPADIGQFRCQCCGGLMKESFSPWHWYSEKSRCGKCGTLHEFAANDHGCKVTYTASAKGIRKAEEHYRYDVSPVVEPVAAIK